MSDYQHESCTNPIFFSRTLTRLYNMNQTTRDGLASYLGVSPQMVSQYLNGKSSPSHTVLRKLADYFNVSVDYLLGRTPNPTVNTNEANLFSLVPKTALQISNMNPEQIHILERFIGHPRFMDLLNSIEQIRTDVGTEMMYQTFHEDDDKITDAAQLSDQDLYNELIEKHPKLKGRLCIVSGTRSIELKRQELEKQFNSIVDIITHWNWDKK